MKLEKALDYDTVEQLRTKATPSITTIEQLLLCKSVELSRQVGVSLRTVDEWKNKVSIFILQQDNQTSPLAALLDPIPSTNATHTYVASGFATFDAMFGNGIVLGQMMAILGESQSGKSQMIMQMAISSSLQGLRVAIIDTTNDVSVKRLQQLIAIKLLEEEVQQNVTTDGRNAKTLKSLELISVYKVFDIWSTLDTLTKIKDFNEATGQATNDASVNTRPFDIVILDSLHNLIAPYLLERESERFPISATVSSSVTATASNLIANIQPIVTQLLVLLRSLCNNTQCTRYCTVVVTNALSRDTAMNRLISRTSTTSNLTRQTSMIASTSIASTWLNAGQRSMNSNVGTLNATGGLLNYAESFDSIVCVRPSKEQSKYPDETLIEAGVLTRPPYYKACPDVCTLNFPRF